MGPTKVIEMGAERATLLFIYMVFSLVVLGWLLESRRIYVELVRLLLAPLVAFIVVGTMSWLLLAFSLLCMMVVALYHRRA